MLPQWHATWNNSQPLSSTQALPIQFCCSSLDFQCVRRWNNSKLSVFHIRIYEYESTEWTERTTAFLSVLLCSKEELARSWAKPLKEEWFFYYVTREDESGRGRIARSAMTIKTKVFLNRILVFFSIHCSSAFTNYDLHSRFLYSGVAWATQM